MGQGTREMQRLAREVAATPGWRAEQRRNGRWHFRGPNGEHVSAAVSPGCWYGPNNARKDLARVGWRREVA